MCPAYWSVEALVSAERALKDSHSGVFLPPQQKAPIAMSLKSFVS